ncbi:MAG TPA: CDP-3,6-dideoxy-D-glycero-L-glycero-4-hexulose-4-reductase [Verrucomicrobia bacterium]|nr:MAG: CDP-3,6-dideoxy-D-glycero-L-glycero-4-hexulose-4-reductase [Lentisphaerae bacterium GWF2_57_35]HBA86160.1 CDP-3,6-dideoxy-D-glycero-L-glycero-4-hexulose-4-reductase [Verrucomicrobiota bacterium]
MATVISVHSFRGGTGKSNTAANLAVLFARQGKRVALIDTDIPSPGVHVLFGLNPGTVRRTLNDYLWGECPIRDAAQEITGLFEGAPSAGRLHLVSSSVNAADIARMLRDGYDINLLGEGYRQLAVDLNLDILLVDTHPGINEETLLSIALSNFLLVVMRPDHQDYQGTALTVDVARELEVPHMAILVNKAPLSLDPERIRQTVETTYKCPVAAVIPHSDDLMTLASQGVFVAKYPQHPITRQLEKVAALLLESEEA